MLAGDDDVQGVLNCRLGQRWGRCVLKGEPWDQMDM